MSDWVFNFPPLTIPEAMDDDVDDDFMLTEDDLRYPRKLVLYARKMSNTEFAKDWYRTNAFTDEQRSLYSAIFKFYGNTLMEEEVRIFASLANTYTYGYLDIVQTDYLALQQDLQTMFKLNPTKLYYINAIERRDIFIRVQSNRTSLKFTDIEPYEINQFELFKQFTSLRVSRIAGESYQSASIVFWSNVTKLNAIDPYGNLYLTKSLDLGALRVLLKNYPSYKDYFTERKKIKLILGGLVDLYTSLNQGVEQLKVLMAERDELSGAMILDLLEKQERVLSSRKPESILTQINAKIVKLNSVFLKFNASFVLSDSRRNSIDLKNLTDNFFYSDYVAARESVEDGLRMKLNEILRTIR